MSNSQNQILALALSEKSANTLKFFPLRLEAGGQVQSIQVARTRDVLGFMTFGRSDCRDAQVVMDQVSGGREARRAPHVYEKLFDRDSTG